MSTILSVGDINYVDYQLTGIQNPTQEQIDAAIVAAEALIARAKFSMVQYDRKSILFTDGVTGVYLWDGSDGGISLVKDLVPHIDDNNGSNATSFTTDQCPYVPPGISMTMHKGRIFIAERDSSRVYYSGTRTDLSTTDNPSVVIRPFELWNVRLDMSRDNPGHGGSIIVPESEQKVVALASTEAGLLVFKQNSVWLWDWPENAAPHEASQGAFIRKVFDGIGVTNPESVAQLGNIVCFIGKDTAGRFSVFRFDGERLEDVSAAIPHQTSIIDDGSDFPPTLAMDGGNLYLSFDNGDGELSLRAIYNFANDAWYDMITPRFNCISSSASIESTLFGCDTGAILAYPSLQHEDYDIDKTTASASIPFLIRTRLLLGEKEDASFVRDKKFRKVWTAIHAENDIDLSINLRYDMSDFSKSPFLKSDVSDADPLVPSYAYSYDAAYSGVAVPDLDQVEVDVSERGKTAQLEIIGSAYSKFALEWIQAGWRTRGEK